MQMLRSLLAMPAWFTENAKWFAVGAAVLIVVIALIAGFSMGWGPLIWVCSCALFLVLELKFHDKNPLLKIGAVKNLAPGVQDLVSTLSIAFVCIVAALFVFGLISLLTRPKRRKKALSRYGDDEDEDVEEEDIDEDQERKRERKKKGGSRIYAASPVLGILVTIVNAIVIVLAVSCLTLVILDLTPLKTGALKDVFDSKIVTDCWKYVHAHTIDFLLLAVLAAFAYGGYRMGMLRGFRSFFMMVAYIAAMGCAMWLPFSKFVGEGHTLAFIGGWSDYFGKLIGNALPAAVATALGKVACGLILTVAFCIIVAICGLLLKLIASGISRVFVFRVVDGVFSMAVMFAVGILVCGAVVLVLYILEYYKVFAASSLFEENSSLMQGIYAAFDQYIKPLLEKLAK